MRGIDHQQSQMFSYLSPETRVRKDHALRAIRVMVDEILAQLSRRFDSMYASAGRPSIPPEKLLRGQLLQMLDWLGSARARPDLRFLRRVCWGCGCCRCCIGFGASGC